MYSFEHSFSMVNNVFSVSQSEIYNVYAVNFPYLVIPFPTVDIFRHEFRCTEKHPLEIRILVVVLHLNQYQVSLGVFR